jgi:hypothetical protein
VLDTGNHGSVSGNQITLDAGTYDCDITAPVANTSAHKARLYDITNSAVLLLGSTDYTLSSGAVTRSHIVGRIVLSGTTVLEVQHQGQVTCATFGMGLAAGFGDTEIYGIAKFYKV